MNDPKEIYGTFIEFLRTENDALPFWDINEYNYCKRVVWISLFIISMLQWMGYWMPCDTMNVIHNLTNELIKSMNE